MRTLLLLLYCCAAALSLSQDFFPDKSVPYTTSGGSVVVAFESKGLAFSTIPNGMQVVCIGNSVLEDFTRSYTNLGGPAVLTDAIASGDGVFVSGAIEQNGLERFFVARINPSTSNLDWIHVEPIRSVGTRVLQLESIGTHIVAATTIEGGFAAVAFNPFTGSESWRTSIPTPLRDGRVTSDASGNVYLISNRANGASTEAFIRSVTRDGFFRWERAFSSSQFGIAGFASTELLVILLGSNLTSQIGLKLGSIRGEDGSDVAGIGSTLSFSAPTTRPLLTLAPDNRVRVSLSHLETRSRFHLVTNLQFAGHSTTSVTPRGRDLATVNLQGALITLVEERRDTAILARLEPDSIWSPIGILNTEPEDMAVDVVGRLYIVGRDPSSGQSVIRRVLPRPIARNDEFDTLFNNSSFSVEAPGVLGNDSGTDGAQLSLVSQPTGGTVTLNSDGSFTFVANRPEHTVETFSYRLQRGLLSTVATVKIRRQPVLVNMLLGPEPSGITKVKGGTTVPGRVIMSGPRQETPLAIQLSENMTATALSSQTVNVQPGERLSDPFDVFTARVREPVRATIAAEAGQPISVAVPLDIDPPFLTALEPVQTTVVGGSQAQFRLTLDAPAPTNGMPISIVDDSTAILVPSTAVVPAGQVAGIFAAPTAVVNSSRTATVTASSNGITKSVTIAIVGFSLAIDPTAVVGGQLSTGTITLTSNALVNSVVFELSDDSPATAPQGPAIVPAGVRVGTFNIVTAPVTTTRTSTINAANGGVIRSVTMSVLAPALQSVAMDPTQVRGGQSSLGTVTLTGRAPAGGIVVTLQAGAGIVQVPASITVAAGQSSATFNATTSVVNQTLMITIAARHNGVTRATTLILTP